MTEAVGNLRANLTADWADFRAELNRSSGAVGDFGRNFAASAGGVARAAAGMFAGFSIANFISNSIQASQAARELEDAVSAAFGNTGEAVNQWATDLADRLGKSQRTVRETALGFQNLFGEIAPTAEAAQTASQRFTELAIDFAELKDISVEQSFRLLQQALAGSTRGIRQYGVDLSQTTLKAEGLRTGVIQQGEELSTEQAILVRSSILMRELGDATGEAERQSGGMAETQERLAARVEQASVRFGDELAPALASVQEALAGALDLHNQFFSALGRGLEQNDQFVIAATQLGQALRGNFYSYEQVAAAVRTVREAHANGTPIVREAAVATGEATVQTTEYAKELIRLATLAESRPGLGGNGQSWAEQHRADIERLRAIIDPTGVAFRNFAEQAAIAERAGLELGAASVTLARDLIESAGGVEIFSRAFETLPPAFREAVEQMRIEEAQDKLNEYRDDLREFGADLTTQFAPESGLEQRIARINEAFREGIISAQVFKEAMADATGETAREEKLSEALAEQAREREEAWGRFRDVLGEVAVGTRDAGDAAKQFVVDWLQARWIEPFLNRLFSDKGTFGGTSKGGGGFDLGGLVTTIFGGGKANGGKANGGPVIPGMAYTVGERGRELFIPNEAGTIVPNDRASRMGGVTMNVYTPDANSFRASRRQIAREQRRAQGVE